MLHSEFFFIKDVYKRQIYAGLPESDPGVTEDAIWPKEMIRPMTINGVTVSVTACCSELSKGSSGNQP